MNDNDRQLGETKRRNLNKMLEGVGKRGGAKTTTRIAVPILDDSDLDAKLSGHFGKACTHACAGVHRDHIEEIASASIRMH